MAVKSVRDFGAACDDQTDDAAAIQSAIDSVGDESAWQRSGLVLHFDGPCAIGSTINVRRKSIVLQGEGWGSRIDPSATRSYLRWIGPAGQPMMRVGDVKGLSIRNLRFVGDGAARPSAAINFHETNDGVPGNRNVLDSVYIGPHGGEPDNATQFDHGILLSGVGANNAELMISNLVVNRAAQDGIHIGSQQNVNITLTGASLSACGRAGIYNSGAIKGLDWGFANCGVDVLHPLLDDDGLSVNAESVCQGFFSEGAGRLLDSPGSGRFSAKSGSFSVGPNIHADGKAVKADSEQTNVSFKLEDFRLFPGGTPQTPAYLSFAAGSTGARHVVLDNIMGWTNLTGGTDGMDLSIAPLPGLGARAYVFFRESTMSLSTRPARLAQNFLYGFAQQWNINRYQHLGEM